MSQMVTMDERKEEAAALLAEGRISDETIAQRLGIERRTLARWKHEPEFMRVVRETIDATATHVADLTISSKRARLEGLDSRWKACWEIILQRRMMYKDENDEAARGGMQIRRPLKYGYTWVLDTELMSEMRAIEKQAAQELGQWVEVRDITVSTEPRRFDFESLTIEDLQEINGRLTRARAAGERLSLTAGQPVQP